MEDTTRFTHVTDLVARETKIEIEHEDLEPQDKDRSESKQKRVEHKDKGK